MRGGGVERGRGEALGERKLWGEGEGRRGEGARGEGERDGGGGGSEGRPGEWVRGGVERGRGEALGNLERGEGGGSCGWGEGRRRGGGRRVRVRGGVERGRGEALGGGEGGE